MDTDTTREEIRALAQQIADMAARSDIECYCEPHDLVVSGIRWYDTTQCAADEKEFVAIALRYLTLRNRINVHRNDPHLVNFHGHP